MRDACLGHLPDALLIEILSSCDLSSVLTVEQTCKPFLRMSLASASLWKALCLQRWGPVSPAECVQSSQALALVGSLDQNAETAEACAWRSLLIFLEAKVRPMLRVSVRRGVNICVETGIFDDDGALAWLPTVRCLLSWVPLAEKRRLAAFVCASWQPEETLHLFLQTFEDAIRGSLHVPSTPESALRRLLLEFPFLPIDAGDGADRVISEFSWRWVGLHSANLHVLGLYFSEPRDARDAVYTLTYSIIMLNTDLHNVAIHPKIKVGKPYTCLELSSGYVLALHLTDSAINNL